MEKLIKKIQEQLDNNWPVESDDIQALIDYIEAGQHETIVIPQDDCEKQAWFIITVMRNMNKDEVEMLCKNLLARFDIDLGKLIQHVNQIKDEKLTV